MIRGLECMAELDEWSKQHGRQCLETSWQAIDIRQSFEQSGDDASDGETCNAVPQASTGSWTEWQFQDALSVTRNPFLTEDEEWQEEAKDEVSEASYKALPRKDWEKRRSVHFEAQPRPLRDHVFGAPRREARGPIGGGVLSGLGGPVRCAGASAPGGHLGRAAVVGDSSLFGAPRRETWAGGELGEYGGWQSGASPLTGNGERKRKSEDDGDHVGEVWANRRRTMDVGAAERLIIAAAALGSS